MWETGGAAADPGTESKARGPARPLSCAMPGRSQGREGSTSGSQPTPTDREPHAVGGAGKGRRRLPRPLRRGRVSPHGRRNGARPITRMAITIRNHPARGKGRGRTRSRTGRLISNQVNQRIGSPHLPRRRMSARRRSRRGEDRRAEAWPISARHRCRRGCGWRTAIRRVVGLYHPAPFDPRLMEWFPAAASPRGR